MHYLPQGRSYVTINKMQESEMSSPCWMPTTCFHCDNPLSIKVYPVDATFKLTDAIVAMDNDRCIGCRFCMVACPYSARILNWGEDIYSMTYQEISDINPHAAYSSHLNRTVEKCDICPQMGAKNELPNCVSACPNGVFYYGNKLDDTISNGEETVRLRILLKTKSGYRYLEEEVEERIEEAIDGDHLLTIEER